MATKESPGAYDCYANAEPDEPMFVLLGRDRHAPYLVDLWADWRERAGEDPPKVAEARACAEAMRVWRAAHRPHPGGTILELPHDALTGAVDKLGLPDPIRELLRELLSDPDIAASVAVRLLIGRDPAL